jgi:hypothetical protein
MAQFYQEPNPTNDPNYLGSSKEPDRIQADTSMGQLFGDIGGMVSKAGPAVEDLFKNRIKDDARSLIEPIQNEHGANLPLEDIKGIAGTGAKGRVRALQAQNGGPTYDDGAPGVQSMQFAPADAQTQQAIGLFDSVTKDKPLPAAATQEISGLKRLNNAYSAGNLSDSYYSGQLQSVVAKLRARYPGFQDEIDQSVSQITGIQPANALRASLQRDIQYNQAAALASQSSDQKWIDQNDKYIGALGLNPNTTPVPVLRAAVMDYKGQIQQMEATKLKAEVGSPQAEAALSDSSALVVQAAITQQGNTAQGNKTYQDFQKQAAELAGNADPKVAAEFVNKLKLWRQSLSTELDKNAYAPIEGDAAGHSMVTKIKNGDAAWQTIKTSQLKPVDDMITLAESKNFSALAAQTDMMKFGQNKDVDAFFKQFPSGRVASAVSTAFPGNPALVNQLYNNSDIIPDFRKNLTAITNAIVGSGPTTPAPTPTEAQKATGGGSTNGKVNKSIMGKYDLFLSPDNKNGDAAAATAKSFFNDTEWYANLNDKARMTAFMTMANPAKTKYIHQLAEKDPEVAQAYGKWAKNAAGDIWQRNSDDLQAAITDKRLDVTFNPDNLQFVDQTKYDRDVVSQNWKTQNSQKLQSINNAITLLKPIVGNDGPTILHTLGINPSAAKQDGLVEKIVQSVTKATSDKMNDQQYNEAVSATWQKWMDTLYDKNDGIRNGQVPVGRQSMNDRPGESLRKVVGSAESGGDYNNVFGLGRDSSRDLGQFTVGEVMALQKHHTDNGSPSSAVGKYQFLRKTLQSLVNEGHVRVGEKFTPDLQEELFTKLAERRGLNDYTSGKIDEGQFANSLAKEWAGLPTTAGVSFYQGDGLNASSAKLPDVMSALRKLRTTEG